MKIGAIDQVVNKTLYAGEWQVVHDSGDFAGTASSYTITGLDGDTDIEYRLICRFIDSSTVGDYKLTFNTDTGNNYGYQDMKGIASVASAVQDTSEAYWHIGQTSTNGYICFSDTFIYAKTSTQPRTGLSHIGYDITGTTVTGMIKISHSWNDTTNNITQMVITCQADNMAIGTRIILMARRPLGATALVGQKTGNFNVKGRAKAGVFQLKERYIATGDMTSYTFSGLTGNTDVLYEVRCSLISNTPTHGDNGYIAIRLNNDSGTNYGYQNLIGSGSLVSAERGTRNLIFINRTNDGQNYAFGRVLIYAKSGFARTAFRQSAGGITTSGLGEIHPEAYAWSNTADEITSIVVLTPNALSIASGTIIELWELKLGV